MFGAEFWDNRYREHGTVWSGDPNPHLVAEVAQLPAGTALDVGCGEGADALWLADRGWQVTAVDISSVALERARALDGARRVTWLQSDLVATDPPASYDLVSAQFMHLPKEPRDILFRRLAAAVNPGGTLLIVAHHPSDLATTARRPRMPELFYTADDIVPLLEPNTWEIVVNASRERSTTDPSGATIAIHDTAFRALRLRSAAKKSG